MKDLTHWSTLRRAGNSRGLKTSYLWLFLVPVAAKLLHGVPEVVKLVWPADVEVKLGLPFSWQVFFASAICVALADLVFVWRCPVLVRDYGNQGEFQAAGKDHDQLILLAREAGALQSGTFTFWIVYDRAKATRPKSRYACATLYGAGFVAFGWVLIENVVFVFREFILP